ncbi:glycosyltransferase [Geomesophilobacter sediminis]|uniref:Glycosyltransferase n=1 Tax=Geomesophilobacter sediminis TaxID=2798584 RepID=A0A8J7M1S3_9BACT|nr:glycosyltransferase [Geomesophilobacter sediminis]MBJ6727103.1 glycosyltransferase [Geomesophilobacter sediminis]
MAKRKGKTNLLHTVLSLETGGLEKMVVDFAQHLDRERYNVEVCCFDTLGALSEELERQGIRATLLQRNQKHYDALFPLRLSRLLWEKKVHILHMHSGTFFIGTQAGILTGTPPMVYTDHGRHFVEPRLLPFMDRFSSQFARKIVAVSKELQSYLTEIIRLPREKVITINNGIDTRKFSRRDKPRHLLDELRIPRDHAVVGTVGRLAQVKDQFSLVKAFAQARQKLPEMTLLLVGDGPMRDELQACAVELEVQDHVVFAGNRSDTHDIYNLFDVFMLTSLSEGTSISLLEAMASGVVPLVTNVGGNPSLVQDGHNGLLVAPKDVAAMAQAICFLVSGAEVRRRLSASAVQTVQENYSIDRMIREYQGMYEELIPPD